MEHDLLISDVPVVKLTVIEGREHCMVLFGISDETVFLFVLVGSIQDHVMLALKSVLVALHVANQHKLRVLRGIDAVPLLGQQCLRLLLHQISNIITLITRLHMSYFPTQLHMSYFPNLSHSKIESCWERLGVLRIGWKV